MHTPYFLILGAQKDLHSSGRRSVSLFVLLLLLLPRYWRRPWRNCSCHTHLMHTELRNSPHALPPHQHT